MLTEGMSLEGVSKMLGHSDIKTTQIYAKILDNKVRREFDGIKKSLDMLGLESAI